MSHYGKMKQAEIDVQWMEAALRFGGRHRGVTGPNPAVAALLIKPDKDGATMGRIVGRGITQRGGRPHAEILALQEAGSLAENSTCYVTLEPCAHHGMSGPCTQALIAAKVARVVCPIMDPDPRVSGKGISCLQEAGISVDVGTGHISARAFHAGFLSRVEHKRPFICLKLALSSDEKIGIRGQGQIALTGEPARRLVHRMRASFDGILIGIGTAIEDNPRLNVRLPGLEHSSPVRIVVDSHLRLPDACQLVKDVKDAPLWIMCGNCPNMVSLEHLKNKGAQILTAEAGSGGQLDLVSIAENLGQQGLNGILVEGGAKIAQSLIEASIVDEIVILRSDKLIGEFGLSPFLLPVSDMLKSHGFKLIEEFSCGSDQVNIYRPNTRD